MDIVEFLFASAPRDRIVSFVAKVVRNAQEQLLRSPAWPGSAADYIAEQVVDELEMVVKAARETSGVPS